MDEAARKLQKHWRRVVARRNAIRTVAICLWPRAFRRRVFCDDLDIPYDEQDAAFDRLARKAGLTWSDVSTIQLGAFDQ